jgi:hypothetical protein
MLKKKRVFDLVFSYNDEKIVRARYEYMKNFIDYSIIIKFDDVDYGLGEKVLEINWFKNFQEFTDYDFNKIINYLNQNFSFNLEDVFIFSKSYEVPNIDTISECISNLNYLPICFEQINLMWNTQNYSKVNSIGTHIFAYSHYLSLKSVFNFVRNNTKQINLNDKICKSGWNFSTFCDLQTFIKNNSFWGNLELKDFEIIDSYNTEYDFKNLKLLKSSNLNVPYVFEHLGHEPTLRKNLTLVISDDINNLYYGDYKVLITETNEAYDDIISYKLNYPSSVLYGDKSYIDFKYDYKKNEVLKIFRILKLIDNDEIHIKIKSERTSSDFICKFSEIKNGTPSLMF